jgi:hypothetical protein
MSDSQSVASTASTSTSILKRECPICKNELQTRMMFNHLRKRHPEQFQEMTQKQWLEQAQEGKPLKFFWIQKNDFDEEESVIIYGCLATNKCFITEFKAMSHFKKSPEALKEHKKEIKSMLKVRNKALNKNQNERKKKICTDSQWLTYKQLRDSNAPELLEKFTNYIDCMLKDSTILRDSTSHLKNGYLTLLCQPVSELHIEFERIRVTWPLTDKSKYKNLSIIRDKLNSVIAGLEHVDGGINAESAARTYKSDWAEFF